MDGAVETAATWQFGIVASNLVLDPEICSDSEPPRLRLDVTVPRDLVSGPGTVKSILCLKGSWKIRGCDQRMQNAVVMNFPCLTSSHFHGLWMPVPSCWTRDLWPSDYAYLRANLSLGWHRPRQQPWDQ